MMTLLEQICGLCDQNSILELDLNNFVEALIYFKSNPKYTELLSKYEFDEKLISEQFIDDLSNLLKEKKALYNKNSNLIFITMNNEEKDNIHNLENSKLIDDLLIDYRKYNTIKEEKKIKKV